MIHVTDGLQLAVTKLKTRRIRLTVTVLVAALMFSVLTFLAYLTQGVVRSLSSFSQEGYGNRYLVQAYPMTYFSMGPGDKDFSDHFDPIQKDLIAQKKAAAKKLNITYDPLTDQTLPLSTLPDGKTTFPNTASKLVSEYYQQKSDAIPGSDYETFKKLATGAGATNTYIGTGAGYGMGSYTTSQPQVTIIDNGVEKLDALANTQSMFMGQPTGIQTITTLGWHSKDPSLLKPFVLPGQNLEVGSDGSIPVVAPLSAAEEILGLKPLPASATSQQKLDRLVQLRSSIAGKTTQMCYRNGASASMISSTYEQIKEIEAGKAKKDYVKPTQIYQLPTTPCGATTVKADTRTVEEKQTATNQKQFDTQFGTHEEPKQDTFSVRIVGISPDLNYESSMSAQAILTSLFTSTLGGMWFSPNDAVTNAPVITAIQGDNVQTASHGDLVYYAEFTTLKDMQAFVKQQSCDVSETVTSPTGQVYPTGDPNTTTQACAAKHQVFNTAPYGNSAGAIEEFRSSIWKVAAIAIMVVIGIASIIMMGNVGKIIADSRRETAVFRALGAKKTDIDQVYLTYTLLVSCMVALAAIIIGFGVAYYVNLRYSPELSVTAVLAYGAQDVHKQFLLFGFNPMYIAAIIGFTLMAGLLGAALPLMANSRRNPIRDMRDDT